MTELGPRQERFCQEYVVDQIGAQAAIRAGYSSKAAKEQACRLLTNVHIQKRIAELQQEIAKRIELDQDWVLERLCKVATRSLQEEPVLDRQGNPVGEYTFNAAGANKALELLGKHQGMFADKLKHVGGDENDPPIRVKCEADEEIIKRFKQQLESK